MAKKKYEFNSNNFADDWGEYRKNSKKKMKHRDESNSWRFDKRQNYNEDYESDDYDDNYDRKTGGW
jgi:hypothetical protein